MSESPANMVNGENPPPKTAKQLEKEKQKLAKLEKFKLKQEKKSSTVPADSKRKAEVRMHFFIILNLLIINEFICC